MRRFSILFFLTTSLVHYSFSQSEFLRRGRSGVGGSVGFSKNCSANAFNLYAGYSYRGFLDANLAYSKADGGKVRGGVLSPSITFYPIKQEDAKNAPTLGISLAFSHYTSKTVTTVDVPIANMQNRRDTIVTELTVDAVKLGVTACHRLGYWKIFFFQPTIGAGLSMVRSGWEFTLRGGVAIGSRMVRGPLFILTPALERQSGITTFVITLGAVF